MRPLAVAVALLLLPAVAGAQTATKFADVATVTAKFDPPQAKPGETVKLLVTVTPAPGAWTYALVQPNGQPAKLKLPPPKTDAVTFTGPPTDPDGWLEKPGALPGEVERYYPQAVTWEFAGMVNAVPPGKASLTWAGTRIQACNKKSCFNSAASDLPAVELEVLPGAGGTPPPPKASDVGTEKKDDGQKDKNEGKAGPTGLIKKGPPNLDEYRQQLDALAGKIGTQPVTREGGLVGLLITAAFWGLVSLATPCVFPMIPITVSLFLKQSNQNAAGAARLAGVYCLTIILVLGLSAWLMLSVFRALSVNPFMNVALGLLFVVFALSLFGMYDITLPNFLLRGAEAGRKRGGLLGTVFGAVAFSIVSFTCVAPFLGGFAGLVASGQFAQWELVLAALTYASAFALPFFVLALVPSLLKALPRSGGWMDTVKAVMGFLELAAALKFFRTAELRWLPLPTYFTYDIVLIGWVVIAAACGLYLLGVFRLPHDEPQERIAVPRFIFALLFLGLGVYLLPGVFKGHDGKPQRPGGVVFAWVDAFLLPEPGDGKDGLPWGTDLTDAIKKAEQSKRLVFVDFTGTTCTNCKANEQTVFPRADIHAALMKYELVQMYTDDVPAEFYTTALPTSAREAEGETNLKFQRKVFGKEQLPLYVILEPQAGGGAKVLAVYDEGLINDVPAFADFLKKPLEGK
jgi:thiol:disulfide interchange protein DsbD